MTDATPSHSDHPLSLTGRTVLITGGNGGIGLGMARACGAAGAKLVIWGRQPDKTAAAVEGLRAQGVDAVSVVCDVADVERIAPTFTEAIEVAGGRIDSVIANAGHGGAGGTLLDVTLEDWRAVMTVNVESVMLLFQAAARHMIDAGGGALVAVSSTSAIHGAAGNLAYGTSKTALLGMVRALAVGLARHRIRVNAILPGWTITDLASRGYENDRFREVTTNRTPVRRWADPDEMGPAAVYLADPSVTFHTGDTMVVDGGYTVF